MEINQIALTVDEYQKMVPNMRITFVISHADLSGGMRIIASYAQLLQKRGHQVTVVSRPKRKATLREWFDHRFRKRPLPWAARPITGSHMDHLDGVKHHVIDECRAVLASDVPDADVIVPTWWETMEWVWPMPRNKGAKVHFMQDYETFAGDKSRVDATCRLPVKRIVIAQWVWDLLVKEFANPPVALIPNAIDHTLFFAEPRGRQAVPTVGAMYTRFRNKGTDLALEAYRLAKLKIPDLKLVMFGGGAVDPALPIPPEAQFFHRLPDEKLRDVYPACDAWLFATRVEAFGLPVLEAMACRTPVIAAPAGAAPELLSTGGGVLVPPENPQAMADALVQLLNSPEEIWKKMSDAAFAKAADCSWELAVDRFERVLQDAVAAH